MIEMESDNGRTDLEKALDREMSKARDKEAEKKAQLATHGVCRAANQDITVKIFKPALKNTQAGSI